MAYEFIFRGRSGAGRGGTFTRSGPSARRADCHAGRFARTLNRRPEVRRRPTLAGRAELRMTMGEEFAADLRAVTDLEGSVGAAGDDAQVLRRALTVYPVQLEKRNFAATSRPRESRGATKTRTIPSAVKREVRKRDQAAARS